MNEDILEFLKKPDTITITIPSYGTFTMLVLVWGDYEWLENEHTRSLPARTFFEHYLENHIIEPEQTTESIAEFSDAQIANIMIVWWNKQEVCQNLVKLSPDADLKTIQHAFITYYKQHILPITTNASGAFPQSFKLITGIEKSAAFSVAQTAQSYIEPINSAATQLTESIRVIETFSKSFQLSQVANQWIEDSLSLTHMVTELLGLPLQWFAPFSSELLQPLKFFEALPDFSEFPKLLEKWHKAEKTFQLNDFWFIKNFLPVRLLLAFDAYPESGRSARISQELREVTADKQFEEIIVKTMKKSNILRPRLPILQEAFSFLSIWSLSPCNSRSFNTS